MNCLTALHVYASSARLLLLLLLLLEEKGKVHACGTEDSTFVVANLKNKKPPATLKFQPMQKGQIFEVYWSSIHKEPNNENHEGMKITVSFL